MRVWRSPLGCLWFFLYLNPVLADEPFVAPHAAHKTVRVGVFDNPPIVALRKNAAPEGIAIDVIREIAAKEGWQLSYVPGSLDEVLELLDTGKIDLQSAAFRNYVKALAARPPAMATAWK